MNEPIKRVFGERVMIDRADINSASVGDGGEAPALADGQALFSVDRIALTANNVTYAAAGDMMGYWRFFPMPDGHGGLPVWGYGDCIASKASGVKKGERVYGYWPLGKQLVVDVDDVDARGFSDSSEHRQGLSPVYNRYDRVPEDPGIDRENTTALYRPLFTTGWLIAQQMLGADDYGAKQVLFSSASSKTAIGAAWSYGNRDQAPPTRIGLTSPQNVDFCKALGIYDRVLAYDQLDQIAADTATAYIDFAGNRALRYAVHDRFGPRLGYSMAVGMTHWTDAQSGEDIPPPETKMFFAPTVMESEQRRLGADGLRKAMASAWAKFMEFAGPHTDVETVDGISNARDAYERVAKGDVVGAKSLIITL